MIDVKKLAYPYPYIPAERRSALLPGHNICSIAPADEPDDDFITGNGSTVIHAAGQPYDEEMSFTHERLYTVQWDKTPMPPSLSEYMPRIRQLLAEGRFALDLPLPLLGLRERMKARPAVQAGMAAEGGG